MSMIGRIACLVAVLCIPAASAAESGDENAACVPGNYIYEYTKKDAPCDKAKENEKCMLHFPCEGQFAKGTCEAVGKCKATSVKICDANTGICSWTVPVRPTLPVAGEPAGSPATPLSPPSGTSPLSPSLENAFARAEVDARIDDAAQRVEAALEKLDSDPSNYMQHFDELREAQRDLLKAQLEKDSPISPIQQYIRDFIAPRLTPTEELPGGEGAPIRIREWFNNFGSTFSNPDQYAELGSMLNDGPPIQLLSGERLARELELQRLTREAEAVLQSGYYPEQTEVQRMIAEIRAHGRTPSELLGGAVSGTWDYLKSWFVPTSLAEFPQSPSPFEYVYSGNLEVNPVSPFALDSRIGEFARPLTSPFDGLYDPGEWIGDFTPGEQVISGNLSPNLREQITVAIVDGGPQGVIDDRGRLWGFQEQGSGQPIIRVDTEEGRKIAELLDCTGYCYESAAAEARETRTLPPSPPAAPPATLPTTLPTAPPTTPTTPATPPVTPPTVLPTTPAVIPPVSPPISSAPRSGSGGGSSFFSGMGNFFSSIGQFLISLFGWFSNQPAAPAPPAPPQPQPPAPAASLTANPPEISRGETTHLFWSSINTDTCAIYLPSGATFISGTVTNSSTTTSPLQITTTFRLECTSGAQKAHSEATVTVR